MARYLEIMNVRELEIARLVEVLSKKSSCFENPKLILIGGYGLRAFIPFVRSTRDCDFALGKENGWNLDEIKKWLVGEGTVDIFEKKESSGYMRCIKLSELPHPEGCGFFEFGYRYHGSSEVVSLPALGAHSPFMSYTSL